MALLEIAVLGVGAGIAKGALRFWLGSDSAPIQEHLWDSIIDVLSVTTSDVLAQRSADRQFQVIAEQSAKNVIAVINAEGGGLTDDRSEYLIKLVGDTINRAIASPSLIVEHNSDPVTLTKYLSSYDDTAKTLLTLPKNERSLFLDLVHEASQHIIDIASELPGYTEATFTEILKREDLILSQASRILEEITRLRESTQNLDAEAAAFENDFRRDVARRLDELQLFGVDLSVSSKRYKLSVAYVSLMVEQNKFQSEDDDTEVLHETLKVEDALLSSQRLLIRGPAGSGKTTLLQWIAITSASRSHINELAPLNDYVPFFLRLRAVGDSLPAPEALVQYTSSTIAGKMPHGWAHSKLESGEAIVLVDGLDEVPEEKRVEVKEWLKSLTENFPKARYVISTRPHAAKEGWLDSEGFVDTELQDMTNNDIQSFIHHWHSSVRAVEPSDDKKAALDDLESKLSATLYSVPALKKLTTSPLLCALICALHRDRLENLPTRRVELYRACVDMFLRRDVERKISSGSYPKIDETQKRTILQELALWMMRGKLSQITKEEAGQRIEITVKSLQSMPQNATGASIRSLFIERSGILREPTIGKVDFPHRTFEEYLAAQAALDDMAISELISHAHDDQWQETIILAAGLSRPAEAEELITGLIKRGDNEKKNQHAIYLLAVAAQQGIIKLPDDSIVIKQVSERLSKIVPPNNITEAKALSAAGDLVVPYLSFNNQILKVAVPNIRCLTMIGTDAALQKIEAYSCDKRMGIIEELEKSHKYAIDPDDFARQFLSKHWFSFISDGIHCDKKNINLSHKQIKDISPLKSCEKLETLSLNFTIIEDLKALTGCTQLISLSIIATNVTDLSPLASCTQLQTLNLIGTKVADLSPLSSCTKLKELNISSTKVTDLSPLASCTKLQTLEIGRTDITDLSILETHTDLCELHIYGANSLDLSPLKGCVQLKSLDLTGSTNIDLSPLQLCLALEHLNLRGLSDSDVTPLANCIQIKSLILSNSRRIDFSNFSFGDKLETLDLSYIYDLNLSFIWNCENLISLDLNKVELTDLSPLKNCIGLETLNLSDTKIDDYSSLSFLKELKSIKLSRAEIFDVSALSGCKHLTLLKLDGTNVFDISSLTACTELKELSLEDTAVEDISPLAACTELKELSLEGTAVEDISPLAACNKLERLLLWRAPVTNITALSSCKQLEHLDLDGTNVTDITSIENCANLNTLDLTNTNISDSSSIFKLREKGTHILGYKS